MTLTTLQTVLLGLILLSWITVAGWAAFSGLQWRQRNKFAVNQADRLALLLKSAPALPMMVKADGRIEAPPRLADWLGLTSAPAFLTDLSGEGRGLAREDAAALGADVITAQRAGRSFTRAFRVQGSSRTILVRGAQAASGLAASGGVVLWFFDATESQAEIGRLGRALVETEARIDSLATLIEAAPIPMWHRGPDLALRVVNTAYWRAVEAKDAADAVARQLELVENTESYRPMSAAAHARDSQSRTEDRVPATIDGKRRMMRLVNVPVGELGVSGYALDIDELEQAQVELRHFSDSQRKMLDQLSAGVAQFGKDRKLVFCNLPFRRIFALKSDWLGNSPEFDRVLERMREAGRVPEARDFPAWKIEKRAWFDTASGAREESWLLPGGQHVRVLVQPSPDGGILVVFEDRTEHAQLASARDTLLRVRTATFENLFEAVGVFEADGRLHLWNARFGQIWGFDDAMLTSHLHVDKLAEIAAARLTSPTRAALIRDMVRAATQERKMRSGRLALKDGRHFEFAGVPLPDGNALFAMLDITDSRKVEQMLRDRADALEEADRLKSAFYARMGYELRTPLTSIAGFAEMLEKGYAGVLEPLAQDYVGAIGTAVERLGGLIDDVLDHTQGTVASESNPALERTEFAAFMREIARDYAQQRSTGNVDFEQEIKSDSGVLQLDKARLHSAVFAMLDVAFSQTPAQGRVLLHVSGDAKHVRVIVSDNGQGFDTDALHSLMTQESLRTLGGRQPGGAGALVQVRAIIEAHGGTLTLASEIGVGTMITAELPRK
ncbi:MAG: PAS-domain containing protein [Alphaproteobacteria bacterium]|nr:PAS-domain containing protein [Alphaproteobacteria bacterium]